MSATAVDRLFRPELVAGGIRRIVAELSSGALAQILLEDGRPVVLIGPDPGQGADLSCHYRVESS